MNLYTLAWAVVLLPVVGSLASSIAESQRRAGQVVVVFSGLAALAALYMLGWRLAHRKDTPFDAAITFWSYRPGGGKTNPFNGFSQSLTASIGVHVDQLALVAMVAITLVSLVILWHGTGYHRGDAAYRRIFWLGGILETTALGIAVAPNVFQVLLLGFTASGAIWYGANHWWRDAADAMLAWRSFLAVHAADLALLLAMALYLTRLGSDAQARGGTTVVDPLTFAGVGTEIAAIASGGIAGVGIRTAVVIVVLLVVALAWRCGQLPLPNALTDLDRSPLLSMALAAVVLPFAFLVVLGRLDLALISVRHLPSVIAVAGALSALGLAVAAAAQRDAGRFGLLFIASGWGLCITAFAAGGYSHALEMAMLAMPAGLLYLLPMGNLVRAYRTRDLAELGGAWPRLRRSAVALGAWVIAVAGADLINYHLLAASLRNQYVVPGIHMAQWVVLLVTGLSATTALLLALVAARTWARACLGDPVRRRGFLPERIRDVSTGLSLAALAPVALVLVGVGLGIPAVPFTLSHFVYYGAENQNLSVIGAAVILAVAVGIVGVLVGVALGRRHSRDAPERARWERWFDVRSAADWSLGGMGRAGVGVARDLAGVDTLVLDGVDDGVDGGLGVLGELALRSRLERLPVYIAGAILVATVIIAATVLYGSTHLAGIAP